VNTKLNLKLRNFFLVTSKPKLPVKAFVFFLCVFYSLTSFSTTPNGTSLKTSLSIQIEQINNEIARLSPLAEKDNKAQIALKSYHQAKSFYEKSVIFKTNEKKYRNLLNNNPSKEEELTKLIKSPHSSELVTKFNNGKLVIELNRIYAQQQTLIQALHQKQSELINSISETKLLPEQIAGASSQLIQRQEDIRALLNASVSSNQDKDIAQADNLSLQMELESIQAQLLMLEAQRLSQPSTLSLLETELILVKQKIKLETDIENKMSETLAAKQKQTETELKKESSRIEQKFLDEFPIIQKLFENNLALHQEQNELVKNYESLKNILKQLNQQLILLEQNQQRLNQQLAIDIPHDLVGEFLFQQRKTLNLITSIPTEEKSAKEIDFQLGLARLNQFKVDDQISIINNSEEYWAQITNQLANYPNWNPLSESHKQLIHSEIRNIVENQTSLLKNLREQYSQYIKLISDHKHLKAQVLEKSKQYLSILDEYLWLLPSNKAIDLTWSKTLIKEYLQFFSNIKWKQTLNALLKQAQINLWATLIVGIVLVLHLRYARRLKERLVSIASGVDNLAQDTFWLTTRALFYTGLLSGFWPVIFLYLSLLFKLSTELEFSHMLSQVLFQLALYSFILQFVQVSLRNNGLGDVHFKWSAGVRSRLQVCLLWFIPMYLLTIPFVLFDYFYFQHSILKLNEVGRLHFLILLVAILFFISSVYYYWKQHYSESRFQKSTHFIFYACALTLIIFGITTGIGYYLSSIRIFILIINALIILLLILLGYSLILRWLSLAEARLIKLQTAQLSQTEQELLTKYSELDEVNELEINEILEQQKNENQKSLLKINEHSTKLLNATLLLLIVTAMAWHFRDITPVLGTMENIALWNYQIGDGKTGTTSLWDLFVSLAVLLLTLIGARNIPGLLQISLLSPLGFKAGNVYAITSIVQYVIFVVGFIISIAWLGLAWTDIQWLVTAMSVGLGFGLKEIFSNFFSGLILLFERPIRIGDVVTIGEVSGTVSKIRIRATTITDWDRKELVIPNQKLILENLVNWTLTNKTTRLTFMLGVAYDTEPDKAHQIILDTIRSHPLVMEEPSPSVYLINFGESSLDFEVRVFIADPDNRLKTKHELHITLIKALKENNIEIPFPQRDIHIKN